MAQSIDIKPVGGKLGVLIPGMGAVATTFIAGVEAIRRGLAQPIGSLTQMGTIRLGKRTDERSPRVKDFLPLANLDELEFAGWDIYKDNCYDAAIKAGVLDKTLLDSVKDFLEPITRHLLEGSAHLFHAEQENGEAAEQQHRHLPPNDLLAAFGGQGRNRRDHQKGADGQDRKASDEPVPVKVPDEISKRFHFGDPLFPRFRAELCWTDGMRSTPSVRRWIYMLAESIRNVHAEMVNFRKQRSKRPHRAFAVHQLKIDRHLRQCRAASSCNIYDSQRLPRRHVSRSHLAIPRKIRRSPRPPRPGLRLFHRGVRHGGFDRSEIVAG